MTSISGTGGGSSSLIQMLQQRFKEADSDGDKALSLDEFTAAGAQGAQGGGGPDPSKLFAKLDTDGNGSVSKDEFTTAFSKIGSETKSALLDAQEFFANADANGDGSLSEDEFAAAAPKGPPPGGPPPGPPPSSDSASASDIFARLDANGDGSLSEDEFAAALDQSADASSASDDDTAQLLNLLKQASDLYASLTAKGANASSVAVSA